MPYFADQVSSDGLKKSQQESAMNQQTECLHGALGKTKSVTLADSIHQEVKELHRRAAMIARGADFLTRHPEFEEFLKLKNEGIL